MSLTDYQRTVLDVLPSQMHRVLRQSLRDHAHRHRSQAYAKRAEASRRSARAAVLEFGRRCDIYGASIEMNVDSHCESGAYSCFEEAWDAMSDGAKHSFLRAMVKHDEWEHAVSLALRLLDAMAGDQADAR